MSLSDDARRRKQAYDDELHRRTLDRLVIQPRKTEHLPELLDIAVEAGYAPSKQAYIIAAVKRQLAEHGILPPEAVISDLDNETDCAGDQAASAPETAAPEER